MTMPNDPTTSWGNETGSTDMTGAAERARAAEAASFEVHRLLREHRDRTRSPERIACEYEALGEEYDDLTDQLVRLERRRLDLHALVWVQRVAIWLLTIALTIALTRQRRCRR